MPQGGSIDLHGHPIGTTGIETMQIQHLFEVKKQALDFPAPRLQAQGIADRQLLRLYDVGQYLQAFASLAPPEPAQGLGGAIRFAFDLNQRVPGAPPSDTGLGQVAQPPPALPSVASTEPAEAPSAQGCKEGANAVQAIPQKPGALGDLFQGRCRSRQFGRGSIGMEDQLADD